MSKSKIEEFFRDVPKDGVFVRSPYNYDRDAASIASGLSCPEETLAQQQFKDENNPNLIMERYARTGDLSLLQRNNAPQFGDFTGAVDYRTALHRVQEAQAFFSELSANVRARFGNDPEQFLAFFADEKNIPEAIKLGLAKEGTPLPEPLAPVASKTVKGDKGSSAKAEPAAD